MEVIHIIYLTCRFCNVLCIILRCLSASIEQDILQDSVPGIHGPVGQRSAQRRRSGPWCRGGGGASRTERTSPALDAGINMYVYFCQKATGLVFGGVVKS